MTKPPTPEQQLEAVRDQLSAEIREAREALKDLRAETKEARRLVPLLVDELFEAEVKKQVGRLGVATKKAMDESVEHKQGAALMVTAGQIYRSAHPLDNILIRIEQYQPGAARAHVVDAITGKRPRDILAAYLHESATTKGGKQRQTGYVLESARSDAFSVLAWCFDHGGLHRFRFDRDPWCTARWVWLDGATEAEALGAKASRFGSARFLHGLPGEQQLAIINGEIPGQKTATAEEPTP